MNLITTRRVRLKRDDRYDEDHLFEEVAAPRTAPQDGLTPQRDFKPNELLPYVIIMVCVSRSALQ
jgi:hypothetical protein